MNAGTESIRPSAPFGWRGAGLAYASRAAASARAESGIGEWREVQPTGSFALCADRGFDEYVARELKRVVDVAIGAAAPFRPLSLILTGSLARGEGALVRELDGRTRWLSDIECLAVVPDRNSLCAGLEEALTRAAAALRAEAAGDAIDLNIQLSPILHSRLTRMRPSIFSCELAAHAKLLWGAPLVIAVAPHTRGGLRARRADALRLLNNRIMEQVGLRARAEQGEAVDRQCGWGLAKFWTDLGTSLSVFLGCYQTTYGERQIAIETALGLAQDKLEPRIADGVRRGLGMAMRVRRGELDAAQWPQDAGFARAAEVAQRVWEWESALMLARPECAAIDGDWRAIGRRLRAVTTLAERGRDWARWCLRPDLSRRMGLRAIAPALRSGSPGNAIHAAGCVLEFFWDEIGERRGPGPEIARRLGAMFGLGGSWRLVALRRQLVGRAVSAWRSHLWSAGV